MRLPDLAVRLADPAVRQHRQRGRHAPGADRPASQAPAGVTVAKATSAARQSRLLARPDGPVLDPSWDVHEVGLEDIVLAYMGEAASPANGTLTAIGEAS